MAIGCNLYPIWAQKVCFWLILQELCDFFWDLELMLFDISKGAGFPEFLVLSNIFGFSAANLALKLTKTVNLHVFVLLEDYLWPKLTPDSIVRKEAHTAPTFLGQSSLF